MTDEAMIEYEGEEAFRNGAAASEGPYSFRRSKFWDAKDYSGFNTVRWKLDAWMRGALSEHDGKGGTRSNRNVDVNVALREALRAYADLGKESK